MYQLQCGQVSSLGGYEETQHSLSLIGGHKMWNFKFCRINMNKKERKIWSAWELK